MACIISKSHVLVYKDLHWNHIIIREGLGLFLWTAALCSDQYKWQLAAQPALACCRYYLSTGVFIYSQYNQMT